MGDEVWGLQWTDSDSPPLVQKTKSSSSHGPAPSSGLPSTLSLMSRPLHQLSPLPGKTFPCSPLPHPADLSSRGTSWERPSLVLSPLASLISLYGIDQYLFTHPMCVFWASTLCPALFQALGKQLWTWQGLCSHAVFISIVERNNKKKCISKWQVLWRK